MKPVLFFLFVFLACSAVAQKIPSPSEFLPSPYTKMFTHHAHLVDYFKMVAEKSKQVKLVQYGETYEHRPLLLAFVSSEANIQRLEDLRVNNLRRTGLLPGNPDKSDKTVFVWFSYSVHGNESAGSESSMQVLYDLVNPDHGDAREWLKNTVVVIDPSVNPDGYSRYTQWYYNAANERVSPMRANREHREPWPGGRSNHYLFDLNRDWAWQTQAESRQRLKIYNEWMPQVHTDIHEMGNNSPYYFAPAAKPYHQYITPFQASFQTEIGKNNARHFDQNGWLYFTREVFDLFYPSYGDTYPTYSGAIGMTYEQGGIGAGRAILTENGDTLTLSDRIQHHRTASLSTIEVSSKNAAKLLDQFQEYFDRNNHNPQGRYKTYIVKGSNDPGKLRSFCSLLDKNQIRYGRTDRQRKVTAYNYENGKEEPVSVESSDLLISTHQPKSVLLQVLLDPESHLEDSATYDITAWSLPHAYALETYATAERINPDKPFEPNGSKAVYAPSAYAYIATWNSFEDARFLAALSDLGIRSRFATRDFKLEGKNFQRGSLIVTAADNRKTEAFHKIIQDAARTHHKSLTQVSTGFSDQGYDLGSSYMELARIPKVLVLGGEESSSLSYGATWYFFEENLQYPVDLVDSRQLGSVDLREFNTIILPDGRFTISEKLKSWVSEGGNLIALGSALNAFADKEGFALKSYESEDAKKEAEKEKEKQDLDRRKFPLDQEERDGLMDFIPGAILKTSLDTSHPMAFGLGRSYFTLKTEDLKFPLIKGGKNVIYLEKDWKQSGFIGSRLRDKLKETTVVSVEAMGRGRIVYMVDNPLFRGFWENGKLLFSNALFF
ncbi:MAG TPA: M14 family zinc carboxypeptidase [Saprospiraceae bacterium]|nr:M14 family zinc carboxypeptidase [Saprospiraceae bacterium]